MLRKGKPGNGEHEIRDGHCRGYGKVEGKRGQGLLGPWKVPSKLQLLSERGFRELVILLQ